jgi:hypothetical protein
MMETQILKVLMESNYLGWNKVEKEIVGVDCSLNYKHD